MDSCKIVVMDVDRFAKFKCSYFSLQNNSCFYRMNNTLFFYDKRFKQNSSNNEKSSKQRENGMTNMLNGQKKVLRRKKRAGNSELCNSFKRITNRRIKQSTKIGCVNVDLPLLFSDMRRQTSWQEAQRWSVPKRNVCILDGRDRVFRAFD
ncbi:hypothetical protein V1478_004369 [Vespula squamosa]|uniref:Uncharacterized protein n=1 Tax=Vespula squamosa TaxID=30214 RepID=A0ABD2BH82_VESSQ